MGTPPSGPNPALQGWEGVNAPHGAVGSTFDKAGAVAGTDDQDGQDAEGAETADAAGSVTRPGRPMRT